MNVIICATKRISYFDGKRVEVDLLEALDLAVLDEAAELGDRDPLLVALLAAAAPAAAPTTIATAAPATTEASAKTSTGWSSVRHCGFCFCQLAQHAKKMI